MSNDQTSPKHEYRSARCYSDGSPLPQGWEIQLNNGGPGEVLPMYRARCISDGLSYFHSPSRKQVEDYITKKVTVFTLEHAEPAPDQDQDQDQDRERTRAGLWFAVAGITGFLVGGIGVGLVATNQAPEPPVTPAACIAAMDYVDDLIEGYGDGFRGSMLSQPLAKSKALTEANNTVQRLTPLYEAEAMKCRVQQ